MPNPLIQLGNLNRLRGSLIFPDFPALNISAPYLGKEGIRLTFEGNVTDSLQQMAGVVQSQEVYQMATLAVSLIKTTSLATLFKRQIEQSSLVGKVTFRSDASNLEPYEFVNCAIAAQEGVDASGTTAAYPIRITGTYYINSELWNGI